MASILPKTQPWRKNWPPQDTKTTCDGIEYGVDKGETVVVDGTSANVKPVKAQPWKKNWPPQESSVCPNGIEYGVGKGDTVVVDGTSANVKPVKASNVSN